MQIDHKTLVNARRAAKRTGKLVDAATYLENRGHPTYGVSYVEIAGKGASYVNLGDSYADTIIWFAGRFHIMSWGAWYEWEEARFCRENHVVRCGWCSSFTPKRSNNVCEVCGNYVDGTWIP